VRRSARISFLPVAGALALLTLLAPVASAARSPQSVFDRHVRASASGSGAWAVDTNTDKVLLSRSPDTRRAPASVEKLLTSATAFDDLGPGFRFETRVLSSGQRVDANLDGDLYIKGAGDPSFGQQGLSRLADRVGAADLSAVSGRVFGDESLFDARRGTPPTGFALSIYFGALTALAFNAGGSAYRADPPRYVARALRSKLIAEGVDVQRSAREGVAPDGATPLASVASVSLASLIRHMNLISDNFYAEMLLKNLGARFAGGGTTAAGTSVVRGFESAHGVSSRVVDGSGLSRVNAVSPRAIGKLLTSVQKESWFNSFHNSMPLAGNSGTLAGRMRGTAADGRCRAKTGTLSDVSALAGYCRARNGHRIAFAILMNGVNVASARAAQDRTVASLAAYNG
jgi:D-alanyl-D-alanine carboxypeptidase/D-alanyl-D-alanine-endopeptidase (penicillin-binding protein 4)